MALLTTTWFLASTQGTETVHREALPLTSSLSGSLIEPILSPARGFPGGADRPGQGFVQVNIHKSYTSLEWMGGASFSARER